ncbi:FAD-binding protein, partial [Candidatus Gracilibacteria bacterium]|nr:FAD-binding protein [Candidatus Gracilibacteria bacterium]
MLEYLRRNVPITELSNYKTPAMTSYFFEISSSQDLEKLPEIYTWSQNEEIPVLIVSGGTNMLFAFDKYPGVIVHNKLSGWNYDVQNQRLFTYGSESIWNIAEVLEKKYNQDLWHRFIGLPGSIAGAVYGNAGCFGLEVENNFLSCEVLDIYSGNISILDKRDMDFSYRYSIL